MNPKIKKTIMKGFKNAYDRAQRDLNDIQYSSEEVLANYSKDYPELIPDFNAHIQEIYDLYNPPAEMERDIRNALLQAYTWNAFSNPVDALRDVINDEEYPLDKITATNINMLAKGTYDTFREEYYKLIKEFSHEKPEETENQTKT